MCGIAPKPWRTASGGGSSPRLSRVTGSELAESGDRDGSARLGSSGAGSGPDGAGGSGVRGEGVGNGAGPTRSGSDSSVPESSDPADLDGVDDLEDLDDLDDFGGGYRVRPFWARTSTLVVFVVVLFVLSGAITAWLRISDLQDRVDVLEGQTRAAEEARQAAMPLAEDLASYDYRDLGGNFRVVKAAATPRFAEQLRQLGEELGPQLQQTRAVAKATVRSAGVVRATSTTVVVALFVDQTVTNSKSSAPRTERSRMELTLLKQGGVWRLDQAGEL